MGLIFEMSVYDLGYIENTQDIELYPNYEEGCRVFCDTFLEEARARCPVRTGYLRSTISADYTSTYDIICEAEADYAQYVEYGTSRQSAQPYFEPALQIALETAQEYWGRAESNAIDRQRELVQRGRELEGRINQFQDDGTSTIYGTGLRGFLIMMLIAFLIGLIRGLFSMLREAFTGDEQEQPDSNHSDWSSLSSFISVF